MATQYNNASTVKVEILKRLKAIRTRSSSYSFRSVQAHLKASDMPSASGWQLLMQRYETLNYAAIPQYWSNYISALDELLENSISCGTSAVWFYDAEEDELRSLANAIAGLVDTTSVYHASFPYPLEETALKAQDLTPIRTALKTDIAADEHTLFLCSKRAFREREPVAVNDMGDQVRSAFDDYDEVIGIRVGFTQAFDRVVIRPSAGVIELQLDLCCPLNADELSLACVAHLNRLKTAINDLNGAQLPWLGEARNLFPQISRLYNSPDGRVLHLGHATGTKSIKEERMRGRTLDLRQELFHKHGIEAIIDTDAYSIKKGWGGSLGLNVPSVTVAGHFSRAGSTRAAVRHAIFENCVNAEDWALVREKLLQ